MIAVQEEALVHQCQFRKGDMQVPQGGLQVRGHIQLGPDSAEQVVDQVQLVEAVRSEPGGFFQLLQALLVVGQVLPQGAALFHGGPYLGVALQAIQCPGDVPGPRQLLLPKFARGQGTAIPAAAHCRRRSRLARSAGGLLGGAPEVQGIDHRLVDIVIFGRPRGPALFTGAALLVGYIPGDVCQGGLLAGRRFAGPWRFLAGWLLCCLWRGAGLARFEVVLQQAALGLDLLFQAGTYTAGRQALVQLGVVTTEIAHELPGEEIENLQQHRPGVLLGIDDLLESSAQVAHVHRQAEFFRVGPQQFRRAYDQCLELDVVGVLALSDHAVQGQRALEFGGVHQVELVAVFHVFGLQVVILFLRQGLVVQGVQPLDDRCGYGLGVAPDGNGGVIENILVRTGVPHLGGEVEQVVGEIGQERFQPLFHFRQAVAAQRLQNVLRRLLAARYRFHLRLRGGRRHWPGPGAWSGCRGPGEEFGTLARAVFLGIPEAQRQCAAAHSLYRNRARRWPALPGVQR